MSGASAVQGPGNGAPCAHDPAAEPALATIAGSGYIWDGDDVLVGSLGRDHIFAGLGNDIICGNGGGDNPLPPPPGPLNPAINPAPNNDACSGGPDLDTVQNCERGGDGSEPGGPSAPPPPAPIL